MTRRNRYLIIAIISLSLIGTIMDFFGIKHQPAGTYPKMPSDSLNAIGEG